MFDYLSQEIDAKLVVSFASVAETVIVSAARPSSPAPRTRVGSFQEQYRGIKTIVIKSIRLLKALAKGNDVVQKRIYDRMDSLLKVRVVESEIALALKEVKSLYLLQI